MWYAAGVGRGRWGWHAGLVGVLIAASGAGRPAGADEPAFVIGEGRVTLVASGVPLREVLDEWARAGGTRFVGVEAVGAAPVSLRLDGVAEREALRLLLQPAAGFLAAPRTPRAPGASIYDRVKIHAPRAPRPAAAEREPARRAAPPPPVREAPALSAAEQRERLQRLLRPRAPVEAAADRPADGSAREGAAYSPTTPRPGMIVEPARSDSPPESRP